MYRQSSRQQGSKRACICAAEPAALELPTKVPSDLQHHTAPSLCVIFRVAEGLRGLAEQTAEHFARVQLRLQLEISTLPLQQAQLSC